MPQFLLSFVRTAVPAAWGAVVAWLLGQGWITPEMAEEIGGWSVGITAALVLASTAAWYAVARWLEPHLPAWLTRIVLGANTPPTYVDQAGQHAQFRRDNPFLDEE
jgi:hypothetical protein